MWLLMLLMPLVANAQQSPFYNSDLSGGLNTYNSSLIIKPSESPDLQNVLIDKSGSLDRRQGYILKNPTNIGDGSHDVNQVFYFTNTSGTNYCLGFSGSTGTYSTDGCNTFTIFVTTLTAGNDVNCDSLNNGAFCVNNQYNFEFTGASNSTIPLPTAPANLQYIRVFNNQCFAAGSTGNLSRLYYSNVNDCTTWNTTTQYIDIAPNNGDQITGIGPALFGGFTVYKKYSIWYVTQVGSGSNGPIFQVVNISPNTGAKNHRSVQNLFQEQLFDSVGPNGGQSGVYAFNGISVYEKSKNIRGSLDTLANFKTSNNFYSINTFSQWNAGTFDPMAMSATRTMGIMQSSATAIIDSGSFNLNTATTVNISTNDIVNTVRVLRSTFSLTNGNFSQGNLTNWTVVGGNWAYNTGRHSGGGCDLLEGTNTGDAELPVGSGAQTLTINVNDNNSNLIKSCSITCSGGSYVSDTCDVSVSSGTALGGTGRLVGLNISNANNYAGMSLQFASGTDTITSVSTAAANQVFVGVGCINAFGQAEFGVQTCGTRNYMSSGSLLSTVFDTSISTPVYGNFTTLISSSSDAGVTFQTQTSQSASGGFSSLASVTPGQIPTSPGYRYFRYKATFTNTVSTKTAEIDISSITAVSTGTWTSPETFLDNNIAAGGFGLFQTLQKTSGNGSIAYSIRTSTFAGGTAFASWVATTPGSSITNSTGAYVQVIGTYTVTASTDIAQTNTITINWTDGTISQTPASSVFQNRYHYCGQSSAGTYNDICYVLDTNGSWVLWNDMNARSMSIVNQNLVMGGAANTNGFGNIFQLYTGDSDNGGAINAYYNTKDYAFTDLAHYKSVERAIVAYSANPTTINLDLIVDVNRIDNTYTVNTNVSNQFGVTYKPVTPALNGNSFRLKFSNNAVNAPWRILGYGMQYSDKGLQP